MSTQSDVYGALLADAMRGSRVFEIVERSDGHIMAFDARYLLAPFDEWDDRNERRAMRSVRGRVLDVGCGGGRVCLYLQDRGREVVGVDSSPGAVACCIERGVRDARVVDAKSLDTGTRPFDTLLLLGQNLGMLRSHRHARALLDRFAKLTTFRGRIVAESFDPHSIRDAAQRRYIAENKARGRMPGQMRVRVRYRELSTPWFDWLQLSKTELAQLLRGTAWRVTRTIGDGPSYVAIIDKAAQ